MRIKRRRSFPDPEVLRNLFDFHDNITKPVQQIGMYEVNFLKLKKSMLIQKQNESLIFDRSKNDIYTRWCFLRDNLSRANNRGKKTQLITVTVDEAYLVGQAQEWKCALSGEPLEFTRGGEFWCGKWCNPNSCTIDRIDSSIGYIPGNIQLVLWRINCIKQNVPNQEFIDTCKSVAEHIVLNNYLH